MEVQFSPEKEARLCQLAAQTGRTVKELVMEAVERLIDHDAWLVAEVEKGIAQADRGELIEHDEVVARIEWRMAERQARV